MITDSIEDSIETVHGSVQAGTRELENASTYQVSVAKYLMTCIQPWKYVWMTFNIIKYSF